MASVLFLGCPTERFDDDITDDDTATDDDLADDDVDDDSADDDTQPPAECPEPDLDPGTIAVGETCGSLTVGTFSPTIEWYDSSAGGIYTAPLIARLTDNNFDGVVDEQDTPDIVVVEHSQRTLKVFAGDGSGLRWSFSGTFPDGVASTVAAIGDVDGDGAPDLVAAMWEGFVALKGADGTEIWRVTDGVDTEPLQYGSLGLYDLDGDGTSEVVAGNVILNGNDGSVRGVGSHGYGTGLELFGGGHSVAADIDQDGVLEVVVGNALYDADGNTRWFNDEADGFVAVADFDEDAAGEIVVASYGGEIRLQDDDGSVLWRGFLPSDRIGLPLVADFDDDDWPEIGVATYDEYTTLDTDGTLMWSVPIYDDSSGFLGSSAFDFEGDGSLEIVFADQADIWVFDAATGAVRMQESQHSSDTAGEYPTIADVDGDGQVEIVVVHTYHDIGSQEGLTVIGDLDESWQPARSIWNQHAYDITNINDDGTIPTNPTSNWLVHNSFRAQDLTPRYPPDVDAVPVITDICTLECEQGRLRLVVQVGNAGVGDLPAGILATLYSINGAAHTFVESFHTEDPIPSGQTTPGHVFDLTTDQVPHGAIAFVVDDPGDGSGEVDECEEGNNTIEVYEGLCPP